MPSLCNESVVIEATEDGNCLFKSTSLSLRGNESLADCLCMLTSCKLYLNANDNVIPRSKMNKLLSRAKAHDSIHFHLLLSNAAFDKYEEQKNLVQAIQCDAVYTCVHYRWCGLLQICALAEILKSYCNIISVYPVVTYNLLPVLNGHIFCKEPSTQPPPLLLHLL